MTRADKYASGLSKLIQCETISEFYQKDKSKFYDFHKVLEDTFPKVFSTCEVENFDGSLLIKWKGESSNNPVVLMNHHDVVEASGDWKYSPFSGDVAEGKLWGRGALDTKGGLYCMLQACEEMIEQGYVPKQDVYFESACTEETDGTGCENIVKILKDRGIRFSLALDEGGMIMYDPIGGADGTFAMVGVGEKCYADVKFVAKCNGGHASTPDKNTPLVRLGKFMSAVDKGSVFDVELSPVVAEMLKRMAPTMKAPLDKLLAEPSKIKSLLKIVLPNLSSAAGAMLKTTIAFTMAGGSDSTNVIPQEAWIIGNMRFSHHQGAKDSLAEITKLAKKYDIDVVVQDMGVESHISSYESKAFKLIEQAVNDNFENVITAPYVTNTASDCRFMSQICDNCLRFTPFVISEEQLESIHGLNENIDVACLEPAVDFYKYLYLHID